MSALDGLRVELPCGAHLTDPDYGCPATSATVSAQADGDANMTYQVDLHLYGVVEQNAYLGGSPVAGMVYEGGAPDNAGWNEARIDISAPTQTFFVNAGATGIPHCFALDQQISVAIDGTATITLIIDGKDGSQVINVDDQGQAIVIGAVDPGFQPYDGQWLQVEVVGVAVR